jgi:hypothetical protein
MPGGVGDRRIGNSESVSSTHFESTNSETPIEGRARGLGTGRSHVRGVSRRGLKGAESAIANRESGIREVRNS